MPFTVLVVGATGKQGGATVKHLLKEGKDGLVIRALTRNVASPAALKLAEKGVKLVQGDLSNKEALLSALQGVDAAFLVTDNAKGVELEIVQGKTFIDAAAQIRLPYLVFSSSGPADQNTGVPHFTSKLAIEEHLLASTVPWAIIRPTAFMDNLPIPGGFGRAMALGVFQQALGSTSPMQMIATDDIGGFAAAALLHPEIYKGKKIKIAGDELTNPQILDAYEQALGTRPWVAWTPGIIRIMPYDLRLMFQWIGREKCNADLAESRRLRPETKTFVEYAKAKAAGEL